MLWTADSVEYRSVSMYAAFSGETLIWIKSTGGTPTVFNIKKVTKSSDISNGDTLVIGCPGYGVFVTDSLYTQAETGNPNMLWETEEKEILGNYVTDITGLMTFKVVSRATDYLGRWSITLQSNQYNYFLNRGRQFTQAFTRLFLTQSNLPSLFVKTSNGRIVMYGDEDDQKYYLVARHNPGEASGLYEGLEFTPGATGTPPSGTQVCYFYKIQPVT